MIKYALYEFKVLKIWKSAELGSNLEINELLKFQVSPAARKDCKQCEYLDKALNLYHPSVSAI